MEAPGVDIICLKATLNYKHFLKGHTLIVPAVLVTHYSHLCFVERVIDIVNFLFFFISLFSST